MNTHQLYNGAVTVEFNDKIHRYKVNGKTVVGVSTIVGMLPKDLTDWAAYEAVEAFKRSVEPFVLTEHKMTKLALKTLSDEAKKAHRAKSQKGKDVGTITHAWIYEETLAKKQIRWPSYSMKLLNDIDERLSRADEEEAGVLHAEAHLIKQNTDTARHCVEQWRQWMVDHAIEIVKAEFVIHSQKLNYCGTVDLLCRSHRTGKLFMADYKTSDPQKLRNSKYMVVGHKAYPEHFAQISGYDYAHHEEHGTEVDGYAVIYLPKEGQYHMFTREEPTRDRDGWEKLHGVYEWMRSVNSTPKKAKTS